METAPFHCVLCTRESQLLSWCGKVGGPLTGRGVISLVFANDNTSRFLHKHHPTPLPPALPTHLSPQNRVTSLNMDITGHFESASCVIEVDGSDTLAHVKGKLVAELGVPRARHVGVRMRGGGDIGNDDLRICDTVMDEGCAVELYCTGITPGVIPILAESFFSLTLSPCDRYLAVVLMFDGVSIFDTNTHERLSRFPCNPSCEPAFSPCSEWISSVNRDTQCAEVHDVTTGALKHSFGDEGDESWGTAWAPCGTKLLSYCKSKGLQVWDIATGVVVHEWSHIVDSEGIMLKIVDGDRVATFCDGHNRLIVWNYTTGVKVLVLTGAFDVYDLAVSPNQRFIAVSAEKYVSVWNIETGDRVFEDVSESEWQNVAVCNNIVAAYTRDALRVWSISSRKQLWHREFEARQGYDEYLAMSSCGDMVMFARHAGVTIVDIADLC